MGQTAAASARESRTFSYDPKTRSEFAWLPPFMTLLAAFLLYAAYTGVPGGSPNPVTLAAGAVLSACMSAALWALFPWRDVSVTVTGYGLEVAGGPHGSRRVLAWAQLAPPVEWRPISMMALLDRSGNRVLLFSTTPRGGLPELRRILLERLGSVRDAAPQSDTPAP